jgi:GMP synthase (glutamine-hydrolysing)
VLVIQHEDDAPAAWFGEWLEGAGVECVVVSAHRGEQVPSAISGYDGLLVLGGAMGAYDDDQFSWLTPTKQLIAHAVAEETPFLGICLGHQLAAVALGGEVIRNPVGRALGLTQVQIVDAERADPLMQEVQPGARAVQWNDDVVGALPPGSTVLAVAPDESIQAARFGPVAWGVQFHPEVSPEVFASWGVAGEKSDSPVPDPQTVARAARQVAEAEDELRTTWRALAERFADIAASASASAS